MTKKDKMTSYGDAGFSEFLRSAFNKHLGFDEEDYQKPIIGIANTKSDINRCHSHFGPIIEAIKRGVLLAGGVPLEFPTISIGEVFTSPTSMLYRNLLSMDTEEMIQSQPIDGVVLLSGCDKMGPGHLMGAASANIPTIMMNGGPMANGEYEGKKLGACSDCRFYWQEYSAGTIDSEELGEINEKLAPTAGHCMVMGSASTFAVCAEALGMMLPGASTVPAVENKLLHIAKKTGEQIVKLVEWDLRPKDMLTPRSFENAITTLMAVGGSTNTVIHLIAIAGRLGIKLPLELFDDISRKTPFIANMRPAGDFQMEDLFRAGGLPVVLKELEEKLHLKEMTVTGQTLGANITNNPVSEVYRDVVTSIHQPLYQEGGIAVLKGNLAPRGVVIKPKAATTDLLQHTGRAVVFHSIEDMEARINDPDLDVKEDDILVLQNAGPVGAPGMPEVGMIPIPKKLLKQGVRDMVRLSDARMSGTAFGTVILHVTPEAGVGGTLALVRTGDMIELNVDERRLELLVSEEELIERQKAWQPPKHRERGYIKLYQDQVLQADLGCDFEFLLPDPTNRISRGT